MATNHKRTTDTATTRRVSGSHSDEAERNTAAAGDSGGEGDGAPGTAKGPQTVDPDLAGQKGDFDGALAMDEKDVQTEAQANARLATTGARPANRNEPQEFIETGPGRVQSTRPVNEPT